MLGLVAAAVGVGAMRAAALIERAFARPCPRASGGPSSAAWCSRDGALHAADARRGARRRRARFFAADDRDATLECSSSLKLSASLVSLASGYRGGLFFASLFVGSLLGKLYAIGVDVALSVAALDPTACMLVGMGTLGAAIVGGPLTMTFLVLESTGDLGVAGGVLAATIATTLAVRATFGYSFTTWRLHLRGETIHGGQDVGWLRELTVANLMIASPR